MIGGFHKSSNWSNLIASKYCTGYILVIKSRYNVSVCGARMFASGELRIVFVIWSGYLVLIYYGLTIGRIKHESVIASKDFKW